jgi:PAS domain S-box-containing protein
LKPALELTQDELRARISELELIVNSVPALISYIDRDEVYRQVNRAYEDFFGMHRDEIIGKTVRQMTGEFHYKNSQPYIQRVLRGEHVSFEANVPNRFNAPHSQFVTYTPDIDNFNRVRGFTVLVQDTTDRKLAELQILHYSEHLRALVSASPLPIVAVTATGDITLWNPAAERLFGWTEDEVLGKPIPFIPEDKLQEHRQMRARDLAGEGFTGHEVRRRRKDGTMVDISVSTAPMRDASGTVIGIMSVYVDITERRVSEVALRDSEMRYRFLAESIPQMVWTADASGNLNYITGQVASYFGASREAILGSGWLSFVHSADRDTVIDRWSHSMRTGETYESEFRLRRNDDQWRWHLVRALPLLRSDGQIASWFGTCTDIEDQKRTEEALRKANQELEEFAYVASHDLQEPLRTVNIYSQLLVRRYPAADGEPKKFVSFIESAVTRMHQLIRDLLAYSRAIHEQPEPGSLTRVADLQSALDRALCLLDVRMQESKAAIRSAHLPMIPGDEAQIAQVFQNLISNALKYCRPGIRTEIDIDARRSGATWTISVRDNGIGFDPQYQEKIFGLFRRLHRDEYPGTGLGLAICKRIVERHGGRIWAESNPASGSIFYFTLLAATDSET